MFSWWSSLEPPGNQGGENPAEGEQKTDVESCSDDVKTSVKTDENIKLNTKQNEESSQDSKASDLDYAKDVAKNVGNFLFSFASVATNTAYKVKDSVKETVESQSIIGDFNKKQDEFVKEKHKRKETAVPPWVGYNEEETMKNQILALSTDERNFLRDPPSGVPFHFESDSMYPVALATLQEDKNLSKMRFKLVPKKISEERFWRNYFYRVSLIKQSTQLTSLAASGSSGSNGSDRPSATSETKTDAESSQSGTISIPRKDAETQDFSEPIVDEHSVHNEFISDSFAQSEQELSHDDLRQIGMEKKQEDEESTQSKPTEEIKQPVIPETQDDIPEWEKELQAELQDFEVVDNEDSAEWEKEIEDMLEEENDVQ